ncbi:hypothetical protein BX600DRAFT_515280 [Xylariales sp. PMI_506]|nr:hypothetical protein BX600DRAFT_515280 [Xylariales sp. PMI_506]
MSDQLGQLTSDPSQDHGTLMISIVWGLLGLSGIFLILRLHIRTSIWKLWWDDLILLLGWLCFAAEAVLLYLNTLLGFGKHALDIDPNNFSQIALYGAIGLTVGTLAINLAKISFAVTLITLTEGRWRTVVWFAIGSLTLFAIPVAILPWLQCNPLVKTFVDFWPGQCVDKNISLYYGIFQGSWAAFSDFSLALIPWKILSGLKIQRMEKIGVGIAMSLGVVAGGAAIMRTFYIIQLTDVDISFDSVQVVVWTAAEASISVIAPSLPILRRYLTDKIRSSNDIHESASGKTRQMTAFAARSVNNFSRPLKNSFILSRLTLTINLSGGTSAKGPWAASNMMGDGESSRGFAGEGLTPDREMRSPSTFRSQSISPV